MTLVVELDGEVIGDLMLRVEDAWAQAEVTEHAEQVQADVGWALHPDHSGRGYATEAVREVLRIAFEDLGLRRVTANCFTDNEASWRLMERQACATKPTTSATRSTDRASGSMATRTRCSLTSGSVTDLTTACAVVGSPNSDHRGADHMITATGSNPMPRGGFAPMRRVAVQATNAVTAARRSMSAITSTTRSGCGASGCRRSTARMTWTWVLTRG